MNRIQVRYFASIREALGTGSECIETSAATVAALRAQLIDRSPAHAQALAHGKAVRSSLDQRMVADETTAALHDGAEVAFFPPVTGG